MTELEKLKRSYDGLDNHNRLVVDGYNQAIDDLAALGRIVPEDWQAMPKQPTRKILEPIYSTVDQFGNYDWNPTMAEILAATEEYKAMLAAAKNPFESEEK